MLQGENVNSLVVVNLIALVCVVAFGFWSLLARLYRFLLARRLGEEREKLLEGFRAEREALDAAHDRAMALAVKERDELVLQASQAMKDIEAKYAAEPGVAEKLQAAMNMLEQYRGPQGLVQILVRERDSWSANFQETYRHFGNFQHASAGLVRALLDIAPKALVSEAFIAARAHFVRYADLVPPTAGSIPAHVTDAAFASVLALAGVSTDGKSLPELPTVPTVPERSPEAETGPVRDAPHPPGQPRGTTPGLGWALDEVPAVMEYTTKVLEKQKQESCEVTRSNSADPAPTI